MTTQYLVLDSRERLAGGDTNSYTLQLRPALQNVSTIRLVHADIPVPAESPEGAFYLRIDELRHNVRGAMSAHGASFVVPATAPPGFRAVFSPGGGFQQAVEFDPPRTLGSITLGFYGAAGQPAGVTAESTIIFEVQYSDEPASCATQV